MELFNLVFKFLLGLLHNFLMDIEGFSKENFMDIEEFS